MHRTIMGLIKLGGIFIILILSASIINAREDVWKFMGRTKNNNFLMYYDPSSVSYANANEDFAEFKVKEELSEEGFERFKENFYKSVKEAEERSGGKVEDPEYWLKLLARYETKEYTAQIDCPNNEFRILPNKTSSFIFVIVNPIEGGSAEEKIKNEVCKKKATEY